MIAIRKARSEDVDDLVTLSKETIRKNYSSFLGAEAVEGWIGSGAVEAYVHDSLARTSVITDQNEVVGFSVTSGNLIDLMMIHHDRHRCGLGTTLLRHCEEVLSAHHSEAVLESFEQNHDANSFYRKNGWSEIDRYFDTESGQQKIKFSKTV